MRRKKDTGQRTKHDDASCQYKNKRPFGLLQRLANVFNLRIIHTYGAAGHGKGVIDAMSSFGVKNGYCLPMMYFLTLVKISKTTCPLKIHTFITLL